ncbi:unnamed protein product [Rotaria sp. Silwood2]|nr:unnamed protein product [Rotaria sp. Silwood2]
MPNGEDVRLKGDHTKSKKVEGTLYMMSERKGWMPEHRDIFTLSFDYCDIKSKYYSCFDKLTESTKKQNIGVSGSFLTNIRSESDDNCGLIYKLNTDTIMSIFRTYPAIREKYEQNVPTGHMSEVDFWRTFFQSHYFTMDQMHNEAERASRKEMAVIALETNEKTEIGYGLNENAAEITGKSLNSSLAHKIVKDLTPGGALMHGTTSQTLSRNLN